MPLRGKVVLVELGAFLKVSALGVEEQRVRVRVSLVDLPENLVGDRYRVEARITTWSSEDVLRIPSAALFRRQGLDDIYGGEEQDQADEGYR